MNTNKIKKALYRAKKARLRNVFYNRDKWLVEELNLPKLTKEEYSLVKDVWPCFDFKMKDLIFMRLYKKEHGFDPFFLCDFQYSYILDKFNPSEQVVGLTNKALYDVYFPNIKFPKSFLRCIRGNYFDESMSLLSMDEAIKHLINLNIEEFIIKPSMDSAGGKGFKRISLKQKMKQEMELRTLFQQYKGDFIIQEPIKQHEVLARLNPTSLNTCRITTIFINGKMTYSAIIKVGKRGSVVDNWNSSYYIGIKEDGGLLEYGYDSKMNRVQKADSDILFGEVKIPDYNCLINSMMSYHQNYLPQCGIVGWDTTIDETGQIIVIEANVYTPGIRGEQLCNGTFFKSHVEAICSSIAKNL